ncbi:MULTISPECIES: hypothetical protein [Methylobacterium]|jgi:hypothetical protein|nr:MULTISPECIES: hypothetical protein [Methylobacterium]MDN3621766.1 hypothetical protein [Methylobacterium isbiliense]
MLKTVPMMSKATTSGCAAMMLTIILIDRPEAIFAARREGRWVFRGRRSCSSDRCRAREENLTAARWFVSYTFAHACAADEEYPDAE